MGVWEEIPPLNPAGEKSRRFTALWLCNSLFRVTYCCGSLSTSFSYMGLGLVGSYGVWGGGIWRSCAGYIHFCSLASQVPMASLLPGKSVWMGLTALEWQWLTAEVAGWLQCKSYFSCFISASWVLFCNGEADVIYWVNLHFSDVARAMVMSENQLRWTAVLLPLTTVTPSHLAEIAMRATHSLRGMCERALGSELFSRWASVTVMFCVPCLTTVGGILGLPSLHCAALLSWDHPLVSEEKK